MYGNRIPHRYALTALVLALAACRGGDAPAGAGGQDARPDRAWTDAARVEAIAATLQACSYEGDPVKVAPGKLQGPAPADCKGMVDKIMGYTGLPANFVVTAGPVPNALAVILLDQQKVPQRVIAFNPDFIGATQRATGGDAWAPVSIMAHEIGHHLSGHTITAGGSRPEIELEADKFSGYVLQKMGAPLADATKAILTFGSDHDQATHPAKGKRADAITQGWQEACRQAGSADCAGGSGTSTAPTTPATPPARTVATTLPAPAPAAIPFKYGRFVVDETGKLDKAKLAELDKKLYDLARTQGMELALLVVNDLHGMSAEDYAWAMMRQLRIGKLDLGNGGVFVVAPNQGQAGVAFAPGIAKQFEFKDPVKTLKRALELWPSCQDADGCSAMTTDLLVGDLNWAARWNSGVKYEIRFTSISDILDHTNARRAERKAGRKWDDKLDQSIGSLVRFTATVTDLTPKPEFLRVNEATVKDGRWRAILVKTEDGKETTLYMQPQTEKLMPAGKLEAGKPYTFTGELKTPGQFTTDKGVIQGNVEMWLFSYDPLD